ncbi:hypothetical protein WESB_1993 [Brachyspira pilosicoli WesB]|uniref:Uncharacterized protein n=1 Tax=Brachyspira pilosicoli WesB TaxID=1161918 RepID=K0JH18_BRAPL|nr:hypothetical protein [Brachyspira pilosicoli]PLV58167.1 hypothetical protein BPSP16_09255 [Brachyspira pilosicoli SP16]WIH83502.1 hypothetical protein NEI00_10915 [Brachyspira pilosicoli]CCG57458.1 hypothetical protein WESB_1993 [Brachyspira pilosicoli WesB]
MKWYEKYPEEFREVLKKIFLHNFFDDYNDKQYILTDHGISVTIEVFENSLLIKELEGNTSFPYLKNKKCADKIIIQKESDKVYNMYIFELTRKRKGDDELIEQFEGACLRTLAVISYFKYITINKVYLFFVRKDMSTDPISFRRPILNKKLLVDNDEVLELDNISSVFSRDRLKIKLLEDNKTYSIKTHSKEYGLNISFL